MALEELLLTAVATGRRPPTVRFWEWGERALVIGSNQVVVNEIDLGQAAANGFRVARRLSGGGTMIAEPGRTITYSLYLPEAAVAGIGFVDSYRVLDAWCVETLRDLEIPAAYVPINDIVVPAGKVGGAAQARRSRALVHHTVIAHSIDPELVPRLIRIGRERRSAHGRRSAEKEVSPLSDWTRLGRDEVVAHLAAAWRARFPTATTRLAAADVDSARRLAAAKFATPAWIDRLR